MKKGSIIPGSQFEAFLVNLNRFIPLLITEVIHIIEDMVDKEIFDISGFDFVKYIDSYVPNILSEQVKGLNIHICWPKPMTARHNFPFVYSKFLPQMIIIKYVWY